VLRLDTGNAREQLARLGRAHEADVVRVGLGGELSSRVIASPTTSAGLEAGRPLCTIGCISAVPVLLSFPPSLVTAAFEVRHRARGAGPSSW